MNGNGLQALRTFVLLFCLPGVPAVADDGLIRVDQIKVHVAKGGGGRIEVASIVVGKINHDILADYGLTARKRTQEEVSAQEKRIVEEYEFSDVLQLTRILDSSVPFGLSRGKAFEISWNGSVFKLKLEYRGDGDPAIDAKQLGPVLRVTTEGRFTENSTGKLSQDRTECLSRLAKILVLEIEGLDVP